MTMILNRKTITGAENVVYDRFGNNTVAFLADIPKNAVVTSVLVNGKHLKKTSNIANEVTVEYVRDEYLDGMRIVAVLRSVYDGNDIVDAAKSFAINEFEVEYATVAFAPVN